MAGPESRVRDLPRIVLVDPDVLRDPFRCYGEAREASPVARLLAPGLRPMWALTRHQDAKAMLSDPRFELTTESFIRPDAPDESEEQLGPMLVDGPDHRRLRRVLAPLFTARRATEHRLRIAAIVDDLLDEVTSQAVQGTVDLLSHFARPLPVDITCDLLGIPTSQRLRWREYGAAVSSGAGPVWEEAMPRIMADARDAVAQRRAEPADDLISELLRVQSAEDRLSDDEIVTLVWVLVVAAQTTTELIANAVLTLLSHPDQLTLVRADPSLMPRAVEEMMRWCGPDLLTMPRFPREDVEVGGVTIRAGEPVMAVIASANRDPRAYRDPERLDVTRKPEVMQLGFLHGPHLCVGAALARTQTEIALTALFERFPGLALGASTEEIEEKQRVADPGIWRLASLPVSL